MLYNVDFSPRDWELAPRYKSPEAGPGIVVLDFDILESLAKAEQTIGSFRQTPDGTLARAPLYVDNLPAAFYHVSTGPDQFTPNHNTTEQETLVVLDGVLKLAYNDGTRSQAKDNTLENTFLKADVIDLQESAISMKAISMMDPARCLAIALYRDYDFQIVPLLSREGD